ncbi:Transport and Golgi organization protein 2 [Mactra antiquata]
MCLLFLYVNDDPDENGYRLVLANNRDELWDRPTDPVNYRDDNKWVGGADLEPGREGGTWLGMSTNGKVAILLNILSSQRLDAKGRGSLVRDFLTQDISAEEYTKKIAESASQYNPFHLLTFDLRDKCHVHSVTFCEKTTTRKSTSGYHGSDNGRDLERPWKKREEGQKKFSNIVKNYGTIDQKDQLVENIINLLNDKSCHLPDETLKEQIIKTGRTDPSIIADSIKARSSVFVYIPTIRYGTRTNTVILVDKGGNCEYVERTLQTPVDSENFQWETKKLQFKLTDDL